MISLNELLRKAESLNKKQLAEDLKNIKIENFKVSLGYSEDKQITTITLKEDNDNPQTFKIEKDAMFKAKSMLNYMSDVANELKNKNEDYNLIATYIINNREPVALRISTDKNRDTEDVFQPAVKSKFEFYINTH